MGRVYAALDRRTGRRLALKTLVTPDPLKLALLKREARVVQGIVHPNLLVLHGLEQLDDTCVLSMELVDGVPLDRWVLAGRLAFPQEETVALGAGEVDTADPPSEAVPSLASVQLSNLASIGGDGDSVLDIDQLSIFDVGPGPGRSFTESLAGAGLVPPSPGPFEEERTPSPSPGPAPAVEPRNPEECERIRDALCQLARAVQALHSVGRVHRDLKPPNVLVERGGRVVLLDFGLALEVDVESGRGQAIGTPGFMAPEQLRAESVTSATDWYAFGAIVYLLLVWESPYLAERSSYSRIARGGLPRRPHDRCPPELHDLADLAWDLLQTDPELRPSGAEVLARLGAEDDDDGVGLTTTRRHAVLREWTTRSGQVLFGRDEQLEALNLALETCREGTTSIAAVHGPSGGGTTALLDAFCEEIDDALVLRGRCYEFDAVPYAGWDALVDALADLLAGLPDEDARSLLPSDVRSLAQLFPVLRRVLAVETAPGGAPPEDQRELRERAFAALGQLLAALARRQPLVVRLDDLHWAGPESIALVLRLLESPPDAPMLVLVSWREGTRAAVELERLTESHRCVDVRVDPLDPEDASGLALHLLSPALSERGELADRIAAGSGGLPLLIRELVLGVDRGIEGAYDLESLIRHRVDELPQQARALLDVVAVIARPVNLATAAEVAGCEQPDLASRLLVAEDLVRSFDEDGVRYLECINSRVRAAASQAPSEAELRALHAAMAELTSAEADPEGKGRHLLAAGRAAESASHLLEAGERALAGLAFERADELFALADQALQAAPDRRRCAFGRAQALAALGKSREAAEQYLAAADARDPEQLQVCQWRATEQLTRAGCFLEARELLTAVLAQIGVKLSMRPLPTLLRLVRHQLLLRLRGTRFRSREEADVPADLLRSIDTGRFVSQGLALFAPVQASLVQAIHLRLALRAGERGRVAMALGHEAGFAAALGGANIGRGERLLERSVEAGDGLDAPRLRAVQGLARSIIAFQRGQWALSQASAERAEDIARMRCRDAAWETGTAAIYLLSTLSLQGEHGRIAGLLPRLARRAAERGNQYVELHLVLCQPVPLSAVQGRPTEGRQEVLEAWSRWGGLEWGLLELYALRHLCELALYEGDLKEAAARVDELWTALQASPARYVRITTLFAHATRLRVSLLAERHGAANAAVRRRDLRALARSGMGWAEAEAVAAEAQLALQRGADGVPALQAAAGLFDEAGMGMHAAACRFAAADPSLPSEGVEGRAGVGWMSAQGVVDPVSFTRMLLPGLPGGGAASGS